MHSWKILSIMVSPQPEAPLPTSESTQSQVSKRGLSRRGVVLGALATVIGASAGVAADRLDLLSRFFGPLPAKKNTQISQAELQRAEEYGRRIDHADDMVGKSLFAVMWSQAAAIGEDWNTLVTTNQELLLPDQVGKTLSELPDAIRYQGFQYFQSFPNRIIVFQAVSERVDQQLEQTPLLLTEVQKTLLRLQPYIVSSAYYTLPTTPAQQALAGIDFLMLQSSLADTTYLNVDTNDVTSFNPTIAVDVNSLLDRAVIVAAQKANQPNLIDPTSPPHKQWYTAINKLLDIAEGKV